MKSFLYCRDPGKAGQNFIPAKWDHVITPLKEEFHTKYKIYRNLLSTLIKKSKQAYYAKYFEKTGILKTNGKESNPLFL